MIDVREDEARVNVTYNGSNSDMEQPVALDASDSDIRGWVTEAVQNGSIPGIEADPSADFTDFVVDRFGATEQVPYARVFCRPKCPFGANG